MENLEWNLNLKDIIDMPNNELSFDEDYDLETIGHESVVRYVETPRVSGKIINIAGIVNVRGKLAVKAVCTCDRCGAEYDFEREMEIDAVAVTEEEPENVRAFTLEGNYLNMTELVDSVFMLNMDMKCLCSDDCKGLCYKCGANLNEGACTCKKEVDPRMAVLEQLLDK